MEGVKGDFGSKKVLFIRTHVVMLMHISTGEEIKKKHTMFLISLRLLCNSETTSDFRILAG